MAKTTKKTAIKRKTVAKKPAGRKTKAKVTRRGIQATNLQTDKKSWFYEALVGGRKTAAGINISNDSALQLSVVFACIRAISEDVGKLPFKLYKSLQPRGKKELPKHPVYRILHDAPNPETTAMNFRRTLTGHAIGWGNGFAEIERELDGTPKYLWPLRPDRIIVWRLDDGRIWYEVKTDDGRSAWLRDDNVLHLPGFGFDGLVGYNVIRYARECLGAAAATQKFASTFFGNGVRSSGILEHPNELSKEAQARLRAAFEQYQGPQNANRLMILEEGMKYTTTSIPPEEAQFLETRQFSVAEICRWFRMPPNKVADTTRAQGWSTLEQTNTDYVVDTLMPWLICWEQEIWRKLLAPKEQKDGTFAKHTVNGLLRGDIAARKDYYTAGRNGGWLSANDIRELEDMNPLPDDAGDIYLAPLNMKELGAEEEVVVAQTAPVPEEAFNSLVKDAAERISASETREIEKVIAKAAENRDKFNKWIVGFFNRQEAYSRQVLEPLKEAWETATGKDFYLDAICDQLKIEGIEAFSREDLDKLMPIWREKRIKDIVTLIRGGMDNADSETE